MFCPNCGKEIADGSNIMELSKYDFRSKTTR